MAPGVSRVVEKIVGGQAVQFIYSGFNGFGALLNVAAEFEREARGLGVGTV